MNIKNLQPGQTVWNVQRQKMGNTTISTVAIFPVRIVEVHPREEGSMHSEYVLASWNGNRPERFYSRTIRSWKKTKPETVNTGFDGYRRRLATREEAKVIRAERAANIARIAAEKEAREANKLITVPLTDTYKVSHMTPYPGENQ
jgi:hypothetical protein